MGIFLLFLMTVTYLLWTSFVSLFIMQWSKMFTQWLKTRQESSYLYSTIRFPKVTSCFLFLLLIGCGYCIFHLFSMNINEIGYYMFGYIGFAFLFFIGNVLCRGPKLFWTIITRSFLIISKIKYFSIATLVVRSIKASPFVVLFSIPTAGFLGTARYVSHKIFMKMFYIGNKFTIVGIICMGISLFLPRELVKKYYLQGSILATATMLLLGGSFVYFVYFVTLCFSSFFLGAVEYQITPFGLEHMGALYKDTSKILQYYFESGSPLYFLYLFLHLDVYTSYQTICTINDNFIHGLSCAFTVPPKVVSMVELYGIDYPQEYYNAYSGLGVSMSPFEGTRYRGLAVNSHMIQDKDGTIYEIHSPQNFSEWIQHRQSPKEYILKHTDILENTNILYSPSFKEQVIYYVKNNVIVCSLIGGIIVIYFVIPVTFISMMALLNFFNFQSAGTSVLHLLQQYHNSWIYFPNWFAKKEVDLEKNNIIIVDIELPRNFEKIFGYIDTNDLGVSSGNISTNNLMNCIKQAIKRTSDKAVITLLKDYQKHLSSVIGSRLGLNKVEYSSNMYSLRISNYTVEEIKKIQQFYISTPMLNLETKVSVISDTKAPTSLMKEENFVQGVDTTHTDDDNSSSTQASAPQFKSNLYPSIDSSNNSTISSNQMSAPLNQELIVDEALINPYYDHLINIYSNNLRKLSNSSLDMSESVIRNEQNRIITNSIIKYKACFSNSNGNSSNRSASHLKDIVLESMRTDSILAIETRGSNLSSITEEIFAGTNSSTSLSSPSSPLIDGNVLSRVDFSKDNYSFQTLLRSTLKKDSIQISLHGKTDAKTFSIVTKEYNVSRGWLSFFKPKNPQYLLYSEKGNIYKVEFLNTVAKDMLHSTLGSLALLYEKATITQKCEKDLRKLIDYDVADAPALWTPLEEHSGSISKAVRGSIRATKAIVQNDTGHAIMSGTKSIVKYSGPLVINAGVSMLNNVIKNRVSKENSGVFSSMLGTAMLMGTSSLMEGIGSALKNSFFAENEQKMKMAEAAAIQQMEMSRKHKQDSSILDSLLKEKVTMAKPESHFERPIASDTTISERKENDV